MITNPNAPVSIMPATYHSLDTGLAALRAGCADLPTADAKLLRRAAKMGLKSETFSREAIELAKQNRDLCPAGLDLDQAERAIAVRDALLSRYLQARQLAEALEVAMQVCGVDAFDAARTAYKSMKVNCRDAALLELIHRLGRNFRGRRAEESESTEGDSTQPSAAATLAPQAGTGARSLPHSAGRENLGAPTPKPESERRSHTQEPGDPAPLRRAASGAFLAGHEPRAIYRRHSARVYWLRATAPTCRSTWQAVTSPPRRESGSSIE